MFGNFNRNLDDKNRVIVPAKLRLQLGNVCYITQDLDNVISLRSVADFGNWSSKMLELNEFSREARQLRRAMLGRTHQCEVDKQGRIKIETSLMEATGLSKEVVFVGVGNKIEIHPKENYDEMQKQFEGEGSLDELANKLLEAGAKL